MEDRHPTSTKQSSFPSSNQASFTGTSPFSTASSSHHSSSSTNAAQANNPPSAIDFTPWSTSSPLGLSSMFNPLASTSHVLFDSNESQGLQQPMDYPDLLVQQGTPANNRSSSIHSGDEDDHDDESDSHEGEDDDDNDKDMNDGDTKKDGTESNEPMKKAKKAKPLPPGTIVCDKSCIRCRERKVKCNRVFPCCDHCEQRKEKCDLINWTPKVKRQAKQADPARIAHLEKRLAELESQLASTQSAPSVPANDLNNFGLNGIGGPSFESSLNAVLGLPPSDRVLGSLTTGSSPDSNLGTSNIGAFSIDWRLATPQMATALSRHLLDAFFDSCCFVLPTYSYFRTRKSELQADEWMLTPAAKVAIAAFRAVGARTSTHSALLGITMNPSESSSHPNAPLLSAGTRRQSACDSFLKSAHQACFDEGLAEDVSIENMGSLMTMMQMALFVELVPKRSRSLLRATLDQYKELLDRMTNDSDKTELKTTFGFGLYSADSQIAAFSRRAPLIDEKDLKAYFSHIGIVIPKLPNDESLLPVLDRLLAKAKERPESLRSVKHLLHCWTCACQREFAKLASPPLKPLAEIEQGVRKLWLSIEKTRATIQVVLSVMTTQNLAQLSHEHPLHASSHHHHHESDYGPQIVRLDRDLLDLINLNHAFLSSLPRSSLCELLKESTSKIRRGLKALAFYAKVYSCGADLHMIYHEFFNMEVIEDWTTMALQKVGDEPGPQNKEEEVSEQELLWLIEGLKNGCFYTPDCERRLAELSPRFTSVDNSAPSPPLGDLPLVTSSPRPSTPSSSGGREFDLTFSIDQFLNDDALRDLQQQQSTSLFGSDELFGTSDLDFGFQ